MSSSYISERIRQAVIVRADSRCEYCGSPLNYCPDPFAVEHIVPIVAGGTDEIDNLALSCQGCNNFKATFTTSTDPVTGRQAPLYNPRQHNWEDHFKWSDASLEVIGLTPAGRATVDRLRLNREGVVNLRALLLLFGERPTESS